MLVPPLRKPHSPRFGVTHNPQVVALQLLQVSQLGTRATANLLGFSAIPPIDALEGDLAIDSLLCAEPQS